MPCSGNEAASHAPPPPRFARCASSSGPPPPLSRGRKKAFRSTMSNSDARSRHRRKPGTEDAGLHCRDAVRIRVFLHALRKLASNGREADVFRPMSLLPKEGGGAPRDAGRKGPHRKGMRRASFLLSSLWEDRGRADLMERARSPFGAPPRHPRFFRPRLGSGRASWNHRMQTGGPSPAPVQRAPRGPTRAGRDDAQAARERSVSLRPREPPPLRPKEYPRERRPFASGMLAT